MIPFVLKRQKVKDPMVDKGIDETCAILIRIGGLYPDLYGWKYWLFGMYANFIAVAYAYYLPVFLVTLYLAFKYTDIELLGDCFCFGSYTFVYSFVTFIFLTRKEKIDDIMRLSGEGLFTYKRPPTEEETAIQKEETRKAQLYAKVSCSLLLSLGLLQMGLVPAINGFRGQYTSITNMTAPVNKNTPLPLWHPYESDTGLKFFITYWLQMIPGGVEYFIINGACSFYVGVLSVLIGNLRRLKLSLKTIHERALYTYAARGGKPVTPEAGMDDEAFQKCLYECLVENIQHHKRIVEFHHRFQEIAQYSIFAIFTGAAIVISAPAYTLIEIAYNPEDREKLLTAGVVMAFHTLVSIFILSSYCTYGQRVLTQSEEILDDFYNTPWPHADKAFRQLVDIAMSNSQLPLKFEAFLIGITASAETFLQIIRAAYTLFNLMVTVRQQGD